MSYGAGRMRGMPSPVRQAEAREFLAAHDAADQRRMASNALAAAGWSAADITTLAEQMDRPCKACKQDVTVSTHGWIHANSRFDTHSARPMAEPYCSHDAVAVVNGICECGTRVSRCDNVLHPRDAHQVDGRTCIAAGTY